MTRLSKQRSKELKASLDDGTAKDYIIGCKGRGFCLTQKRVFMIPISKNDWTIIDWICIDID